MTREIFHVDIPNRDKIGPEGCEYENLGSFPTKAEAVQWIRENIDANADDNGNICLITEDMEPDDD